MFFRHLPRRVLYLLSRGVTAMMYPFVHSLYRFNIFRFLPYFDYFGDFRRLAFKHNVLNVFDKLNAPQTMFVTGAKTSEWFSEELFEPQIISIRHYLGVSYSLTGIKKMG